MNKYLKALIAWAIVMAAVVTVGIGFGYAVDAGGNMTPARLKLVETLERGDRVRERLIGTLNDMIEMHCTWSEPK